ncbi:DUF1405 domain-containing protein [Halocatena halophila]|uniref:DUF1405 domain-containing protein n=1 Tax=Halocatena halophila TaxID=2814576 RepID=UPI002ED18017
MELKRWGEYYLDNTPSLVWLLFANAMAVLVGLRYYVETLPEVFTFVWPLYADSPTAVALALLSLTTLLGTVGKGLDRTPRTRVLAYLHTFAFVWLVKYGLWTVMVLNVQFDAYFPAPWAYFGIILTHLLFVVEAAAIPLYGTTTRGALLSALLALLINDFLDYGLDWMGWCGLGRLPGRCSLYPPLRSEPGFIVVFLTVALSIGSVLWAHQAFERYES